MRRDHPLGVSNPAPGRGQDGPRRIIVITRRCDLYVRNMTSLLKSIYQYVVSALIVMRTIVIHSAAPVSYDSLHSIGRAYLGRPQSQKVTFGNSC